MKATLNAPISPPVRQNKALLWVKRVALGIVFAVLLFLLFIFSVLAADRVIAKSTIPSVFGFSPLTVLTGSMEPEINIGDFVITRARESYAVGDVVMYQTSGTGGEVIAVTHEIIAIDENGDFITKGINNESADVKPVPPENVVGKVVAVWRGFGNVAAFLQSPAGICILLVVVIIIWFLIDLIPGGKKKHSDEENSAEN